MFGGGRRRVDDDCAAKERSRTPNVARKRVVMAMRPRSEPFDDISRLSGMTVDIRDRCVLRTEKETMLHCERTPNGVHNYVTSLMTYNEVNRGRDDSQRDLTCRGAAVAR